MSREVEMVGLDDVLDILDQLPERRSKNLLRSTLNGVASEAAKAMKQRAPRQTGDLRKAIKPKRRRQKGNKFQSDVVITHGNVKNDAFYWHFVEYGTPKVGETPFIRPVVDSVKPRLKEILNSQFAKKVQAAINREIKKRAK